MPDRAKRTPTYRAARLALARPEGGPEYADGPYCSCSDPGVWSMIHP